MHFSALIDKPTLLSENSLLIHPLDGKQLPLDAPILYLMNTGTYNYSVVTDMEEKDLWIRTNDKFSDEDKELLIKWPLVGLAKVPGWVRLYAGIEPFPYKIYKPIVYYILYRDELDNDMLCRFYHAAHWLTDEEIEAYKQDKSKVFGCSTKLLVRE